MGNHKTLTTKNDLLGIMVENDEILQIKDQLRKLEIKIDCLKDFTIDEIAKTRVNFLKEFKDTGVENQGGVSIYQ